MRCVERDIRCERFFLRFCGSRHRLPGGALFTLMPRHPRTCRLRSWEYGFCCLQFLRPVCSTCLPWFRSLHTWTGSRLPYWFSGAGFLVRVALRYGVSWRVRQDVNYCFSLFGVLILRSACAVLPAVCRAFCCTLPWTTIFSRLLPRSSRCLLLRHFFTSDVPAAHSFSPPPCRTALPARAFLASRMTTDLGQDGI